MLLKDIIAAKEMLDRQNVPIENRVFWVDKGTWRVVRNIRATTIRTRKGGWRNYSRTLEKDRVLLRGFTFYVEVNW